MITALLAKLWTAAATCFPTDHLKTDSGNRKNLHTFFFSFFLTFCTTLSWRDWGLPAVMQHVILENKSKQLERADVYSDVMDFKSHAQVLETCLASTGCIIESPPLEWQQKSHQEIWCCCFYVLCFWIKQLCNDEAPIFFLNVLLLQATLFILSSLCFR